MSILPPILPTPILPSQPVDLADVQGDVMYGILVVGQLLQLTTFKQSGVLKACGTLCLFCNRERPSGVIQACPRGSRVFVDDYDNRVIIFHSVTTQLLGPNSLVFTFTVRSDIQTFRAQISAQKAQSQGTAPLIPFAGVNIAFTSSGLRMVGSLLITIGISLESSWFYWV